MIDCDSFHCDTVTLVDFICVVITSEHHGRNLRDFNPDPPVDDPQRALNVEQTSDDEDEDDVHWPPLDSM